ncbi:MAG TPA: MBL fold metallo-hydrolase [Clostridia bacterium]|nr:MBL fold metallo-hydrolase [Clostridia bacterium]
MNDWFTIEKIDEDTFAISEYGHWEQTHCYLLLGTRKALLIDTGLGVLNIEEVVRSITSLPVVVATTHAHWDHIGGHRFFSEIAVHEAEAAWLSGAHPMPFSDVMQGLVRSDCSFPEEFDPVQYRIYEGGASILLRDHSILDDLGARTIEAIHTPGHSPGHVCFYEPARRYLYTGDLIYAGCLYAFFPSTDPVQYRQSVKKIWELPVARLLPAHNRLDLPVSIIGEIDAAFDRLYLGGKLGHGAGTFDFGEFSIRL